MRFMTWNVENFFMPGAAFGVTDQALFDEKVTNLATMITAHEPDVLGLQEVGDPAALDRLKSELGPKYPQALTATRFDTMHPIRTAALLHQGVQATDEAEIMNFPPGSLVDVPQASGPLNAMARGALNFTATIDTTEVRVVVMHLKSKLLTYPGSRFSPHDENERARAAGYALFRRAAEAVAVRVQLDDYLEANESAAVVAIGDLNDGPDAATTQILYGPPDQSLARKTKATGGDSSTSPASYLPAITSAGCTTAKVNSSTTSSRRPNSRAAT